METSRPLVEANGHELVTSYPTEPVWVEGDPTRLSQIVANLLNNAAKYTDRGGRIVLAAHRDGDEAIVQVSDNGIGLSPAMLTRVFDLFAQADRSLDRSQGGLGIGLTLVRSLTQLHGGSVSAHSRGPGQGSEFIVRLPALSRAPSVPALDQNTSSPEPSARPRLRVLVVDDSQDSAHSLARVLNLWGYEVRVVHDGHSAIEAACTEAFDVIFLDIGLPGINGYQAAQRLNDRFGPARPVLVAVTGYGQAEDVARSRSVGFDDHLVKPVNLDKLRESLAEYTSKRTTEHAQA